MICLNVVFTFNALFKCCAYHVTSIYLTSLKSPFF